MLAIVERARWLVSLPRASASGTPALRQRSGIKVAFKNAIPTSAARPNSAECCHPERSEGSATPELRILRLRLRMTMSG
jgi:hypothetical protein